MAQGAVELNRPNIILVDKFRKKWILTDIAVSSNASEENIDNSKVEK